MSAAKTSLLILLFAAGCVNPDGEIRIANNSTGQCMISVKFDENTTTFTPLASGMTTHEVEAGIRYVGFRTDGDLCGGPCMFLGANSLESCNLYAADGFPGIVTIVDEGVTCGPGGMLTYQPRLTCATGP